MKDRARIFGEAQASPRVKDFANRVYGAIEEQLALYSKYYKQSQGYQALDTITRREYFNHMETLIDKIALFIYNEFVDGCYLDSTKGAE